MRLQLGMGLTLGGGSSPRTLDFVAGGGASATTISPSGIAAGDLLLGLALNTTTTTPTHDATGGALIGTWSSNASSAILFWKWAESSTPAFGTHTNANRVQWAAWRFSAPPADPIGAVDRITGASSLTMSWLGLTLEKSGSHVFTMGYRAANEAIVERPGATAVSGTAGVTARYKPMRSSGAVTSWPQEDVTQTIAGIYQSIAVEVGY